MKANEETCTTKTENISVFEKIAYGGGDLASNLILVLTSTFVTFFYTDALGLNAAIIGTIMMFSRLADGFTDIFMGYVFLYSLCRISVKQGNIFTLQLPIIL